MPTWPASLPQKVTVAGFSEQPPQDVLRSVNDQGPTNDRPRSTAGVRDFAAQIACSDAQVETFETFFLTEIAQGALPFDWVHPRTQQPATVKIAGRPQYTPRRNGIGYRISFPLQINP